jgi:hypothetical protein
MMTVTCITSSAMEMPLAGSKIGAKNETAPNKNDVTRGTMIIMAPSMTNLSDNGPLKEGPVTE